MRVGLDARGLIGWQRLGGVGHYAYQLIRHLPQVDDRNEYRLIFNFVRSRHWETVRSVVTGQARARVCRFPPQCVAPLLDAGALPLEVLAGRVDVFHSPFFKAARLLAGKLVVTVHDLMHVRHPEFLPPEWVTALDGDMRRTLRWADLIIAVSEFTKRDMVEAFGFPDSRIRVIHHGVDAAFAPLADPREIERVRRKYGIPGRYVLSVGTLEPKKNHLRLIQAFLAAAVGGLADFSLVLAGGRRWAWPDLDRSLAGIPEAGRVILPGLVPASDLPALYSGASCFVLPSLFEGFGMPVLEAMACGTPVIASNVAALPEVCGDAALLVNPLLVDELAEALTAVLSQEDLRVTLRNRGLQRAKTFSWERTARETVAVYEGL